MVRKRQEKIRNQEACDRQQKRAERMLKVVHQKVETVQISQTGWGKERNSMSKPQVKPLEHKLTGVVVEEIHSFNSFKTSVRIYYVRDFYCMVG